MSKRSFNIPVAPANVDDLHPQYPYTPAIGIPPEDLPSGIRIAHQCPLFAAGVVQVTRHRNALVNLIAQLFGLPKAGKDVSVRLIVIEDRRSLVWFRQFNRQTLITSHRIVGQEVWEKAGIVTMRFRLYWRGDRLEYKQVGLRMLGVPIPSKFAPSTSAIVAPIDTEPEIWQVRVSICAPLFGVVCQYEGKMWRQ